MKKALTQSLLLAAVLLIGAGCNPQIDSSVATFNAQATQIASAGGQIAATLAVTQPPTPTPVVITYDLVTSSDLLIHAWGQAYGLPSSSQFTIIASQDQVAEYIVQTLQLGGFQDSVKGGTVAVGSGQLRLDLSLIDTAGATGAGTITFQPTLGAGGALKLNLIGSSFGALKLPDGLLGSIGDAVERALMGAPNEQLSKVNLSELSLENGTLKVSGTVK